MSEKDFLIKLLSRFQDLAIRIANDPNTPEGGKELILEASANYLKGVGEIISSNKTPDEYLRMIGLITMDIAELVPDEMLFNQ